MGPTDLQDTQVFACGYLSCYQQERAGITMGLKKISPFLLFSMLPKAVTLCIVGSSAQALFYDIWGGAMSLGMAQHTRRVLCDTFCNAFDLRHLTPSF